MPDFGSNQKDAAYDNLLTENLDKVDSVPTLIVELSCKNGVEDYPLQTIRQRCRPCTTRHEYRELGTQGTGIMLRLCINRCVTL